LRGRKTQISLAFGKVENPSTSQLFGGSPIIRNKGWGLYTVCISQNTPQLTHHVYYLAKDTLTHPGSLAGRLAHL